jgi:hypothetical protein
LEEIQKVVLSCIIHHNMMVWYCQDVTNPTREDYLHYAINESFPESWQGKRRCSSRIWLLGRGGVSKQYNCSSPW